MMMKTRDSLEIAIPIMAALAAIWLGYPQFGVGIALGVGVTQCVACGLSWALRS